MTGMVTRKAKLADFSQNQISEYVFYVCSVKAVLLPELLKEQNDKSERKMVIPAIMAEFRQLSLVWKTELVDNMFTWLSSETAVEAPSKT